MAEQATTLNAANGQIACRFQSRDLYLVIGPPGDGSSGCADSRCSGSADASRPYGCGYRRGAAYISSGSLCEDARDGVARARGRTATGRSDRYGGAAPVSGVAVHVGIRSSGEPRASAGDRGSGCRRLPRRG